jgi:hypothetical protein
VIVRFDRITVRHGQAFAVTMPPGKVNRLAATRRRSASHPARASAKPSAPFADMPPPGTYDDGFVANETMKHFRIA